MQQTLEQADAMIKTTERQDKLSRSSPHFVQRSDDSVDNSVDTADETSNTEDKGGTRSEYVAADVDVEKEASEENANRDVNADAQSEKEKHNAPLIFLHFHKTGGSSLCEVLRASGLKMTEVHTLICVNVYFHARAVCLCLCVCGGRRSFISLPGCVCSP